jgi:hypothetical protein
MSNCSRDLAIRIVQNGVIDTITVRYYGHTSVKPRHDLKQLKRQFTPDLSARVSEVKSTLVGLRARRRTEPRNWNMKLAYYQFLWMIEGDDIW